MIYIQNFSNEPGIWRRELRLVTYATEISLLQSLVASQLKIKYDLSRGKSEEVSAFLLKTSNTHYLHVHCTSNKIDSEYNIHVQWSL